MQALRLSPPTPRCGPSSAPPPPPLSAGMHGARLHTCVLTPVCTGVFGGPATPLAPPQPLPQSLGTSGAGRRGLGGNEEERTMEGKPGEGRRKETPAPCRWRFCGSVTCLPAPRPVVLGGGVSPGLCVTLGYLDLWRHCWSPWAPGELQACWWPACPAAPALALQGPQSRTSQFQHTEPGSLTALGPPQHPEV